MARRSWFAQARCACSSLVRRTSLRSADSRARCSKSLDAEPDERGKLTVALSPEQMKITHTAAKLLLDDLQRGQAEEREVLRSILGKLPDEHTIRAITLP